VHTINGRTADEAWCEAAKLLVDSGEASQQSSRDGQTTELLHVLIQIDDPSQRWIASRVPALNPAFALVEVFWIAAGRQDAALPTYWNPALPQFCGEGTTHHGAYGYRLRRHFGVDQIDRVYRALASSPDSRQCVLQLWDSAIDLPHSDGTPVAQNVPCNVVAFPKVRRGKLEWLQVIRSNDLFLGVPHNIVQFTSLQEMISGWLGVKPGAYGQLSDSLHVYARDLDSVRSSLVKVEVPRSTDDFALDRCTWDKVIVDVIARLEALTKSALSTADFTAVAFANDAPRAYDNSVLIAAADSARRRAWDDLADECVARCTNPALVHLWSRWRTRRAKSRQAFSAANLSA
jgi:thymidylate synthase